jgi:hypothetical protein
MGAFRSKSVGASYRMPKPSKKPVSKKKVGDGTGDRIEVVTDPEKSIDENFAERVNYWKQVQEKLAEKKANLKVLQDKQASLPDVKQHRIEKANLRLLIKRLASEVAELESQADPSEYMACFAKVILEFEQAKTAANSGEVQAPVEVKREFHSVKVTDALGHAKQQAKKKKRNEKAGEEIRVKTCDLDMFNQMMDEGGVQNVDESVEYSLKLAKLLGEIPTEKDTYEYCPSCPGKIVMEVVDKPPSQCCPRCGLSKWDIDISSSAVHDKETSTRTPFTYRPRQHYDSWIHRITGRSRVVIPESITNIVLLELDRMQIHDVNLVTWDVVHNILHKLTKKVDPMFSDYYQHVYAITNIIRGSPILTLTEGERQTLLDMFDIIYESWERNNTTERTNFLSNASVLQISFALLGYPPTVIGMFNMLKGQENRREYDRIITTICQEQGWDWEKVQSSVLENIKHIDPGRNILSEMGMSLEDFGFDDIQSAQLGHGRTKTEQKPPAFAQPARSDPNPQLEDVLKLGKRKGPAAKSAQPAAKKIRAEPESVAQGAAAHVEEMLKLGGKRKGAPSKGATEAKKPKMLDKIMGNA